VLGNYDDALHYYEHAVATIAQTDDTAAHARFVGDLGRLYRNLGYMDQAIASSQEALDAAIAASDRAAEGRWKDRLGLVDAFVGRLDEGRALLDEAVAIAREFGDRRTEGAALSNRGLIFQLQGQVDAAEDDLRQSLQIARDVSDRRGEAIILGRLAFAAEGRQEYDRALPLFREAFDISVALGERREQSYQLLGLGRARLGLGQLDDAEAQLLQARDLSIPETGYLAGMALVLVLLRRGSADARASAAIAVADTIARCDDRLARSARLYATRYVRATALAVGAVLDPRWDDVAQRDGLLEPALHELDAALATCAAPGVVATTLGDLDALPSDDLAALGAVRSRLLAVEQRRDVESGGAVATTSVPRDVDG
jgi:tetratricopeptide (TPR) repeat protein